MAERAPIERLETGGEKNENYRTQMNDLRQFTAC